MSEKRSRNLKDTTQGSFIGGHLLKNWLPLGESFHVFMLSLVTSYI